MQVYALDTSQLKSMTALKTILDLRVLTVAVGDVFKTLVASPVLPKELKLGIFKH